MSFYFSHDSSSQGQFCLSGWVKPNRVSREWIEAQWDNLDVALRTWRGEFALLAWHSTRDEGVAIRDPLGARPLYAYVGPQGLKFSTRLSLLLQGASHLTPNLEYLERIQKNDFSALEESPFKEIRRCPPGCFWRIRDNQLQKVRYFHPQDLSFSTPFQNRSQWLEVGRKILFESVRLRSSASGSFGVFLSGGLDSSLVARMLDESGVNLTAFSVVDDRFEEGDKRSLAAVAAQLRSNHQLSSLAEAEEGDLAPDARFGGVFYDPCLWLFRPLLRSAKNLNVTKIFTGLGGDDVFQPNWEYLADLPLRKYLRPMLRKLSSPSNELSRGHAIWRYLIRPRLRRALLRKDDNGVRHNLLRRFFKSGAYIFAMEQEQEMAAHFGLEMSYPLLDLELIAYALATPPELFFDEQMEKVWLRRLAQGLVAEQVTSRMSTQNYDALRERILTEQKRKILSSVREANLEEENAQSNHETLLKKYYTSQCILQSRGEEIL